MTDMDCWEIHNNLVKKLKIGDTVLVYVAPGKISALRFAATVTTSTICATVVYKTLKGLFILGWKDGETFPSNAYEHISYGDFKRIYPGYKYNWVVSGADVLLHSIVGASSTTSGHKSDGLNCSGCGTYCQYAEANMPNNQFVCWTCRQYPHYRTGYNDLEF